MTTATKTTELENARKELAAARAEYNSHATWNKAKKVASEQVEFWSNKVSFLSCLKVN